MRRCSGGGVQSRRGKQHQGAQRQLISMMERQSEKIKELRASGGGGSQQHKGPRQEAEAKCLRLSGQAEEDGRQGGGKAGPTRYVTAWAGVRA